MLHKTHAIESTPMRLGKKYVPVIDALDLAMKQWALCLAVGRRHVAGEVVPKNCRSEYLIPLVHSAFRLWQYIPLNDVQHALDFGRRGPQWWFLLLQDYAQGAIARGGDGGRRLSRRYGLLYNVQCGHGWLC